MGGWMDVGGSVEGGKGGLGLLFLFFHRQSQARASWVGRIRNLVTALRQNTLHLPHTPLPSSPPTPHLHLPLPASSPTLPSNIRSLSLPNRPPSSASITDLPLPFPRTLNPFPSPRTLNPFPHFHPPLVSRRADAEALLARAYDVNPNTHSHIHIHTRTSVFGGTSKARREIGGGWRRWVGGEWADGDEVWGESGLMGTRGGGRVG